MIVIRILGGLGNQLFQYAYAKSLAAKGYDVKIDIAAFKNYTLHGGYHLDQFKIDVKTASPAESWFAKYFFNFPKKEKRLLFQESFLKPFRNKYIKGYFQTEKYFKNIEDEIRQDFTFKNEISLLCKHKMSEVDRPIALHIRRGDFLINSANHNNLGLDYYEASLDRFDSNRNVIIFSDDSEWCKEQNLFEDDRFLVSEGNDSYTDLCLMSLCTDFIIANSTFSWWGAWLSKSINKVVCSPDPKKWFGPNNAHLDTSDIIPKEWVIIK